LSRDLEGKGCVDEDPDASETTLCRVSPSYPLTGKSDVSIDSFETVLAFISNMCFHSRHQSSRRHEWLAGTMMLKQWTRCMEVQ